MFPYLSQCAPNKKLRENDTESIFSIFAPASNDLHIIDSTMNSGSHSETDEIRVFQWLQLSNNLISECNQNTTNKCSLLDALHRRIKDSGRGGLLIC